MFYLILLSFLTKWTMLSQYIHVKIIRNKANHFMQQTSLVALITTLDTNTYLLTQYSIQEDTCILLHTVHATTDQRNEKGNKACCTIGIGSSILARTFFGVRSRGCIVYLSEKLSVSMWNHATHAGIKCVSVMF